MRVALDALHALASRPRADAPTQESDKPLLTMTEAEFSPTGEGWRMPENAVYVGRPTPWGNPFVVGYQDVRCTILWGREKCVEMFKFSMCPTDLHGIFTDYEMNEIDLNPLRGKDLACWCPLDQPCHADVLLELANAVRVPAATTPGKG